MKRKKRSETLKAADIVEALGGVTKEKSISVELVLDTLKDALATAAKRYLNKPATVEVKVDQQSGGIEVYQRQMVVETVVDPEKEIALADAQEIDPDLGVGDELIQDLDIDVFGRTAIGTAKQVILQRVREAERNKIFDDFSKRIGELVTGTVQQIDKGNILVNLSRTEALIPFKEQIRRERYRQGDTIKACIVDVRNTQKGPQIIISRTAPEFLARLFELEVPEIADKTVRIVKVVRDPGHRSKIAVTTTDSRVDPVGACVGMRGNRVQAIVRELSTERIDIINWTDELSLLVRRVFSPAEVKRVIPVGETRLVVIISESDLAQAIGKDGQNIRLASKMIDKEIDVYGDEEFGALSEEERERIVSGKATEPASGSAGSATDGEASSSDGTAVGLEGDDSPESPAGSDTGEENASDDNAPIQQVVEGAIEELADSEAASDEAIENAAKD